MRCARVIKISFCMGLLACVLVLTTIHFHLLFGSEQISFDSDETGWEMDVDVKKCCIDIQSRFPLTKEIRVYADGMIDPDSIFLETICFNGGTEKTRIRKTVQDENEIRILLNEKRVLDSQGISHFNICIPKNSQVSRITGAVIVQAREFLPFFVIVFLIVTVVFFCFCGKNNDKKRMSFRLILMSFSAIICFLTIELTGNEQLAQMEFSYVLKNTGLYFLFIVVGSLLFQSAVTGIISVEILSLSLAVINHFVIRFRGNPLQAADIFSLKTALQVSDQYQFTITRPLFYVICYNLLWMALILSANKVRIIRGRRKSLLCMGAGILTGGLFILGFVSSGSPVARFLADEVSYWNQTETYRQKGFAVSLFGYAGRMGISRPEGYSSAAVQEAAAPYILKASVQSLNNVLSDDDSPDIIMIMNEAMADYRHVTDLEASENVFSFWDYLDENTVKGWLQVPVYAGGTANTEYEILTGNSMGFFRGLGVPYVMYPEKIHYGLPRILAGYGYQAIAMHPNVPENYKRDIVYPELGFEEFFSTDDLFSDSSRIRGLVSDEGNYQTMISWIEHRQDSRPLFIFNITMQNHSDYQTRSIPITAFSKRSNEEEVNEYLTLIKESDKALEKLVHYLKNRDKKTLLIVSGDHFPALNDHDLFDQDQHDEETDIKKYQTPFLIWANYDIPERTDILIGANYLNCLLMDLLGLPKTGYQMFLDELAEEYPVIVSGDYLTWEGDSYTYSSEEKNGKLLQYDWFQYNQFTGDVLQSFFEPRTNM